MRSVARQVVLTRSDVDAGMPLLEVEDLRTHFLTETGTVRAVDGVSFTPRAGPDPRRRRRVGLGQDDPVPLDHGPAAAPERRPDRQRQYEGTEVAGAGPDEMRGLWGTEMAMVFQDPMTSLNPVMKVGNQITESLRHHLDMDKSEARETAIALLRSVGIPEPAQRVKEYPHQLSRRHAPAGDDRHRPGLRPPPAASPTSPPRPSTSPSRPRSWTCSRPSRPSGTWRWSWSPTTSAWSPAGPTTSR